MAAAILPKRDIKVRRWGSLPLGASWKFDDPKGLGKSSGVYGMVAAPLIIFLIGPAIIGWLNDIGFVLNL